VLVEILEMLEQKHVASNLVFKKSNSS